MSILDALQLAKIKW